MLVNPKLLFALNFILAVVNGALFFSDGGGWFALWTFLCGSGAILSACLIVEEDR